jgi:hypothetical protein
MAASHVPVVKPAASTRERTGQFRLEFVIGLGRRAWPSVGFVTQSVAVVLQSFH